MLYLIALIFPPLAVLLCGKPFQAMLNILLCCLLILPGIIHALMVANNYYADARSRSIQRALIRNIRR